MPKAPRHRKRVRAARDSATAQPLGAAAATAAEDGSSSSTKKVGKKEAEVTNLLDKLRSDKVEDRTWAAVSTCLDLKAPIRRSAKADRS